MRIRVKAFMVIAATLMALIITACATRIIYTPDYDYYIPDRDYSINYNYITDDDGNDGNGSETDYFISLLKPTHTPHGYIGRFFVQYISNNLPGRVAFTYREYEAALWIEQVLLAMGFNGSQITLQSFFYSDVEAFLNYFSPGRQGVLNAANLLGRYAGNQRYYSQNVILTIPGQSESTIIVGAHYDSFRYAGASDNASGTALLLEAAQRIQEQEHYHTLIFVFFGSHELGLLGTLYFYESLSEEERGNIELMIVADVLIEGPDLTFVTGYISSTPGVMGLGSNTTSIRMVNHVRSFEQEHDFILTQTTMGTSDERVFLARGHTIFAMWGLERRSPVSFGTNFLHSHRDSYEYISNRFPGMVEQNMRAFSLLLESMLLRNWTVR
ncbi:MAG: M28 family peptidase [Defluviitaleaceae bacterium]|nr:M28 family peptidase [Defluviitaleaceae bacterium]